MSNPLVSILMAAYNAQQYVCEAVDSVQAQSLEDWELIVVDDASTDQTWELLQAYAEKDSRIRVFRQSTNQGQAVARNRALREVQGAYVCMLDADDWFSPDALEQAVCLFGNDEVDSVVFALRSHFPDGHEEEFKMPFQPSDVVKGIEAFEKSMDWTIHGLYMVRRELYIRYPFDDRLRLYSDDNTTHFHYLHSRFVAFCGGVYYYRHHAHSSTIAISPLRFLHLESNWLLMQQLQQEGIPRRMLEKYNLTRWYNFKSLLRLYHTHYKAFTPSERKQIHSFFVRLYHTFGRRLPFFLFELRQWMGFIFHKYCRF